MRHPNMNEKPVMRQAAASGVATSLHHLPQIPGALNGAPGLFAPCFAPPKVRESPLLLNPPAVEPDANCSLDGMETITIELSNGGSTVVNEVDGCFLRCLTIHRNRGGYATVGIGGRAVGLQRIIAGLPHGLEIDHINRDRLDNRRCNLRTVTHGQNRTNMGPMTSTGYKRVSVDPRYKSEPYQVMVNGRFIGRYSNIIEAAKASDAAAYEEFGEYAYLNFPEDYPTPKSNIAWPRHGSFVPYALESIRRLPRRHYGKPKKYARLSWPQIKAIRARERAVADYMEANRAI